MSINLTTREVDEIWAEAEQHYPPTVSSDRVETIYTEPPTLGSGYEREIELCAGLDLCITDRVPHDLTERVPENEHLVQFIAYLSGVVDSGDYLSGDYLRIDSNQSYIGSSGIQPPHFVHISRSHHQVGVDIHITPALFHQFFANFHGELLADLQPLVQNNEWQNRFSPKMTGAMRTVVQQIINCPFLGAAKRFYLQGKVFELIALQLDGISESVATEPSVSLKAETIARIHRVADILRSYIENPPAQTQLAKQVGLSDRTLRRGFKQIFGTTVLGYLTEQRLLRAEQLLHDTSLSVAEVVYRCGYSNQGHFAAAFKRRFGITPKQCAMGHKVAP